jgi:hypothetical protein
MIFAGGTLTIDDADAGGSESGAWATAIAHTPHLAAQLAKQTARERTATPVARAGEAGVAPFAPASPTLTRLFAYLFGDSAR